MLTSYFYFFFGLVFVDFFLAIICFNDPRIFLVSERSSLYTVPSGFFSPRSFNSLDLFGVAFARSSSFNDFLNGTFFNLMVPYSIRSKSVKVNGEVCQKISFKIKRLGFWSSGQSSAHPLSIEVSVPWIVLSLLFFLWAGLVFAPAYTIIIWSLGDKVNHFLWFGPIFFWLDIVPGWGINHKWYFAHRERSLL